MALTALGLRYAARGELEAATRIPEWRAAAALELVELLAAEDDVQDAQRWIENAASTSPQDERIAEEQVVLSRLARKPDARTIAESALKRFPASVVLRLEWVKLENPDPSLWSHLAADPQRVLDGARAYIKLNDFADALSLLKRQYPAVPASQTEPGSVLPQAHPMVAYYRAYCREQLGLPAASDYREASKLTVRYIFPNRAEE